MLFGDEEGNFYLMCEAVDGKGCFVHKLLRTEVTVQQSLLPLLLSVIILLSFQHSTDVFRWLCIINHIGGIATDHDGDNDTADKDYVTEHVPSLPPRCQ